MSLPGWRLEASGGADVQRKQGSCVPSTPGRRMHRMHVSSRMASAACLHRYVRRRQIESPLYSSGRRAARVRAARMSVTILATETTAATVVNLIIRVKTMEKQPFYGRAGRTGKAAGGSIGPRGFTFRGGSRAEIAGRRSARGSSPDRMKTAPDESHHRTVAHSTKALGACPFLPPYLADSAALVTSARSLASS